MATVDDVSAEMQRALAGLSEAEYSRVVQLVAAEIEHLEQVFGVDGDGRPLIEEDLARLSSIRRKLMVVWGGI